MHNIGLLRKENIRQALVGCCAKDLLCPDGKQEARDQADASSATSSIPVFQDVKSELGFSFWQLLLLAMVDPLLPMAFVFSETLLFTASIQV